MQLNFKQKDQARTTQLNSVFLLNARLKGIAGGEKEGLQGDFSLKSLSVVPPRIELGSKV